MLYEIVTTFCNEGVHIPLLPCLTARWFLQMLLTVHGATGNHFQCVLNHVVAAPSIEQGGVKAQCLSIKDGFKGQKLISNCAIATLAQVSYTLRITKN